MSAGERVWALLPARSRGSEVAHVRARPGQAGFSLVEVLVVAFVAVPVILAGAYGLFTAISASGATKDRQDLEAALTSYAESLKALPTYTPCATAPQVNTAYGAWADRWEPGTALPIASGGITVTGVQYWKQSTATYDAACGSDGGAQKLTITATHKNGTTLTGTVVLRNPAAKP
jgi:type II secretory pathway pseudopilin PulG